MRSAGRIGLVIEPIINPHNLHIDGFNCQLPGSKINLILLDIHVRDLSPKGIIINDNRDLSEVADLVRLKPVIDIKFQLIEKVVLSGKKKIGKVAEYAIDDQSLFIQKIYVQPPIWQSVNHHRLIFDRSSIIEVTDTQIVVSGSEEKETQSQNVKTANMQAGYSSANTSLIKE